MVILRPRLHYDATVQSRTQTQSNACARARMALGNRQSRSQSMPVRGLGCVMPQPNQRTGMLWERDWGTGGKFAVAGQQIAGASENFVLNY